MLIKGSKSKIYIKGKSEDSIPLIFIHGFTGTSNSWNAIREGISKESYAIDIPGHGKSIFNNTKSDYTLNDFSVEFFLLLNSLNIDKINLCGYSMGGRLCLEFANKYPNKINSLILESTSQGIENIEERDDRLISDKELSKKIENDYSNFINHWENNKLFKKQKDRNLDEWKLQREIRTNHDHFQLAKSLNSFSLGRMNYYGDILHSFNFQVILISGNEDEKYLKIGHKAMRLNNNVQHFIVDKSGHNSHLENPDLFVEIINSLEL